MRYVIGTALVMTCLAGSVSVCAQAPSGLWISGKRVGRIVIPTDPLPDITFAAEEFRSYLLKRCGEDLPIAQAGGRGTSPAVHVGPQSWVKTFLPAFPELPEEGVLFRATEDGDLFLVGGGTRGVVHAVYAFLERKLGIRWYQPEPWGTEIPRPSKVELSAFEFSHEPSFWYRDISVCLHPSIGEWAIRNRLNTNLRSFAVNRGGQHAHAIGGHAFSRYISADLFEEHPDYFPLKDGARFLPRADRFGKRRYQACTTHPDVLEIFVNRITEALNRSPDKRLVSLSPDDVTGRWCSCPTCVALDTGEMMMLHGREMRVVSDRFFHFVNQVSDAIAKPHPDAWITTFAYHQYRPIPRRRSVRDNVIVMLCQPGAYNHPINSGASEQIQDFNRNLVEWTGECKNLILYRYMFKTMWESLPYPRHRILAEDLKYAHSLGLAGEHGQSQGKNWGMLGLNWYLHARLLWDVNLDIDALLDDYYRGYFREAEIPMRSYFELMADAFRNADGPIGEFRAITPKTYADRFLTPELLSTAREHLNQAGQVAQSERVKRRVKMVEIPFRYAEHYMAGLWAQRRFADADRENDLRTAVAEYDAAVEAAKEGETLWAMAYNFREGAKRWLTEREIPKLRRELGSRFSWQHRTVVDLPRTWRFRFEDDATAEEDGWWRTDFDAAGWSEARVDRTWQQQELKEKGFEGAAWYRTTFELPDTAVGSKLALYFGGIDAAGKVWVNGTLAGEHAYVANVSWNSPCEIDVTDCLVSGRNHVAVRVYTGGGSGGLYRPIHLLTPSEVVLIRPEERVAWGRPKDAPDGMEWELNGSAHKTATIRTPNRPGENPYDGAWIEFEFDVPAEGDHQAWLRVVQYQASERKAVLIDGVEVGSMTSEPHAGERGYTQFHRVGRSVRLTAGKHRLRVICTGIRGWIDPINAILLAADPDVDYEARQTDRSSGSAPCVFVRTGRE
ncbi:MAG: DUF4838 domain-containing protein [Lentisphaerae bacterium]|jgi:hypothetical protein|nr:DUF4838 domain-containing protein [Lentisphaerota bacterium]MBT4819117.1 DUF4838 domain-containing protein [Lentisphaerota bacterium]MBT5606660.1 DUF4838 domain-containing protein [Lentisphaerota bacterium]MBT7057175.1 DUF4838 domain-containing protein [Lentisphaerota bacterium]MBT7847066.1 DUF4838 domain-containing protein [Lentisphaerota bacterium]